MPDPISFAWSGEFVGTIVRRTEGSAETPVVRSYAMAATGYGSWTVVQPLQCSRQPCPAAGAFTGAGTLTLTSPSQDTLSIPIAVTMTAGVWHFRERTLLQLRNPGLAGAQGLFGPAHLDSVNYSGLVSTGPVVPG